MKKRAKRVGLHEFNHITQKILKMAPQYAQFSDEKLQNQTNIFRQRIKQGETLEEILPEAFAVVREADKRVLHMEPFENQVLGAVALHYGNIAEMKTGEGKTLTATMPMYLNGLQGPGNFLVTANSYLAYRDATEIGKLYRWLGLSVAAGVPPEGQSEDDLDKDKIYGSDVVYTTNSAIGFDYLIDNLASNDQEQHLRGFRFCLIDEVDSILLDMAQTPLIISGAPKVQSNLFESCDKLIKVLEPDVDFELSDDAKKVWFTEAGIDNMEQYFGITDLLSEKWRDLYRHLILALNANQINIRNKDYVVHDDKIMLLDEANGRELTGTKLEAGMHQALEAKEGLEISSQTRAMASITYQNLFRMFSKLAGMSGTAKVAEREFRETYNLAVYLIPTHRPMIRRDHKDQVYVTNEEKIMMSVAEIKQAYATGRPVLVETGSVSMSNLYSRILLREGIAHNLLNARSEAKEATIVKEAGQKGAVTVATSMAGRGTDIKLGQGVKELGGLLVVGTERMESLRVDDQLRGRSGRQGDPGESKFFVSLEDKIVIEQAPKWVKNSRLRLERKMAAGKRQPEQKLHGHRFKTIIKRAQTATESSEQSARFQTLQFDEIFRIQRGKVYEFRDSIMNPQVLHHSVAKIFADNVQFVVDQELPVQKIYDFIFNNIDYNFLPTQINDLKNNYQDPDALKKYLHNLITQRLQHQKDYFEEQTQYDYFLRIAVLKAIDTAWIEQVDNLQQLKSVVMNRSQAQRNPIYEYQKEARESFKKMKTTFWKIALQYLMLSTFKHKKDGTIDVEFP